MRKVLALALAGLTLLGWAGSGAARVHGEMYCWAHDSEFPVTCEQDDEDEEDSAAAGQSSAGAIAPIQARHRRPQPVKGRFGATSLRSIGPWRPAV